MNAKIPIALLACLVAAGCSLPSQESRGEEPSDADRSDYGGGTGLALLLSNSASEPFDVTFTLLAANGTTVASTKASVPPNGTFEKWWSLPSGSYTAGMRYSWHAPDTARWSGDSDERRVDLSKCPELTRIGWSYMRQSDVVASAWKGDGCASA
ncbi:MAG TPA: hypothetical protein VM370_03180 [Candidatus Thermoplasmatota archaeon]|nr:hypothetical protein [Candidatus Thermoplasmatota archaeon]